MANNNNSSNETGNKSSKRGFGSMDEDKQREIASQGGKAAHQKGTAHEFDSQSGAEAGRKGGLARQGGGEEKLNDVDSALDSNLDDALDR